MSTTSKSPKDVLFEAWSVAGQVFPDYSHKNSPKQFTQVQLFACLVLKNFLKLDYRGLQNLLRDCSDLTAAIEMRPVPHFTTFQKASRKLLAAEPVQRLLDETVSRMMGRRKYGENMFNLLPLIPQVWNPRRPAPTLSNAVRVRKTPGKPWLITAIPN